MTNLGFTRDLGIRVHGICWLQFIQDLLIMVRAHGRQAKDGGSQVLLWMTRDMR
jgi:hypothetical protein